MTRLRKLRRFLPGLLLSLAALVVLGAFAGLVVGESFFAGCEDHCADEEHDTCACAHCISSPRIVDHGLSFDVAYRGDPSYASFASAQVSEQLWVNAIDHPPRISG